jgi:hypothetical protein
MALNLYGRITTSQSGGPVYWSFKTLQRPRDCSYLGFGYLYTKSNHFLNICPMMLLIKKLNLLWSRTSLAQERYNFFDSLSNQATFRFSTSTDGDPPLCRVLLRLEQKTQVPTLTPLPFMNGVGETEKECVCVSCACMCTLCNCACIYTQVFARLHEHTCIFVHTWVWICAFVWVNYHSPKDDQE